MDEQIAKLAIAEPTESPRRHNGGWFQAGDKRINRDGRPRRSSKATSSDASREEFAQRADRVKRLVVRERRVAHLLTHKLAPWIANLPSDWRIVDCHVARDGESIIFVIRSERFDRVGRGALIPEIDPEYYGLTWRERT